MKAILAVDKELTEGQLKVIEEITERLKEAKIEVELIGGRPNDR